MATNGHAHPEPARVEPLARAGGGGPEYLVIVHPAGDLDAPHLARYWTEVPALSACTADGGTVEQAVENTRRVIARWLQEQATSSLAEAATAFRLAVELAF